MAENDDAVLNAAVGYVFVNSVGAVKPTPAEIKSMNFDTFGNQVQTVKVTGNPTGGTLTLTVGGQTTSALPYNATAVAVKAALGALTSVGSVNNVWVTGLALNDAAGLDIAWVGAKAGTTQNLTTTPTLTGGTSPAAPVTQKSAVSGWKNVGHTSRGKIPEFGYEGGKSEVKGSWQKKKLRKIDSEDPIDYVTVVLHQFDLDALSLYYGENASTVSGEFAFKSGTQPNEKSGLVVIEDGDVRLGFHFYKAEVQRDDKIDLPIDDLAALPVKFTFLDYQDEALFAWISQDLLV